MNHYKNPPTTPSSTVRTTQAESLKTSKDNTRNYEGFGLASYVSIMRGHIVLLVIGTFVAGLFLGWGLAASAFRYFRFLAGN